MSAVPGSFDVDIAVVGRGAIGVSTALALARTGRSIALVGPASGTRSQPPPGLDTRVFAISTASAALLRSLGVWQALDPARTHPVQRMQVLPSTSAAAPALVLDAYEASLESLASIVEGGELSRVLEQALRFSAVRVLDGEVSGLDCSADAAATIGLADGRRIRTRLVVGADGAGSVVRTLAGIEAHFSDYGQRAVVGSFYTAKPHRDTAWQWFGDHGILALLPLPSAPGDQASGYRGRVSMVWSAPDELAAELIALPPAQLAARVSQLSGHALGELSPLSAFAAYPLRLGQVNSMIGPRLALVGDAAHHVHPLAGQGMNLGFGDVAALRDALADHVDPGARIALRRYERSRAEPVLAMRLVTDGLQRMFDSRRVALLGPLAAPFLAVRDLGWSVVASTACLRRRLVAHASSR